MSGWTRSISIAVPAGPLGAAPHHLAFQDRVMLLGTVGLTVHHVEEGGGVEVLGAVRVAALFQRVQPEAERVGDRDDRRPEVDLLAALCSRFFFSEACS